MGALAEATIPEDARWIPKGMEVRYTAKADSDIRCRDGTVVIEGVVDLGVTPERLND